MIQQKNMGLTLIELMVTIAVLAIVSAIAMPSFTNLVSSNRLTGLANDLNSSLASARAEAIKMKTDVTVAPVGGSWARGWTVSYIDGGTTVELLKKEPINKAITLGSGSSTDSAVFNASGYSVNSHLGSTGVVFCGAGKDGRKVDVSPSGITAVERVECQ
ncbi:MAG: GspH/FimT family pseudopilin [Kangiella sp.]|jgi:type IV fimbrial biogenesis protein FimT|nr:GspH/FimT family pseudopilin [Kangiella sp.]MCW9027790.1 GspH/FimT family pseudopilin [Kangiella sp.]